MKTPLIILNIIVLLVGIAWLVKKPHKITPPPIVIEEPIKPPQQKPLIKNNISKANPSFMNYEATVAQLKQWNTESDLTEIGVYGKTARGKDCYYLRIKNDSKPKVLITACIHGNEPLASSTVMWYIGNLLVKYGKDEHITKLLDSRDIYFVPVVSPDSYPSSRHVDGVDPNRDFPGPSKPNHKSTASVKAIQDLFSKIKPNAVISAHTWGRVYLTPHGDKMQNCADHEAIMVVMTKMKELSGYRCIRACDMYGNDGGLNNPPIRSMGWSKYSIPIHGSEVDWYYRGGAFSIVMEMGSHQRVPSDSDIAEEFNKTFSAFLWFVEKAPLVKITSNFD